MVIPYFDNFHVVHRKTPVPESLFSISKVLYFNFIKI